MVSDYVLSSKVWCPLRFPHSNDVTSRCLKEFSCLIYVICVNLCIVVYKTYCVVFLFCLYSYRVPYVAIFSGPFLIILSVSSNVYLSTFDAFVSTVSSILITQTGVPLRFNCQHIVWLLTKLYIDWNGYFVSFYNKQSDNNR